MPKSQAHEQRIKELQQAAQKLSSSMDERELQQWASTVGRYASQLSSNASGRPSKTELTIDFTVPSPEAFTKISEKLRETTSGVKEVSFMREGSQPRVRIQATREAIPEVTSILAEVSDSMSYSS